MGHLEPGKQKQKNSHFILTRRQKSCQNKSLCRASVKTIYSVWPCWPLALFICPLKYCLTWSLVCGGPGELLHDHTDTCCIKLATIFWESKQPAPTNKALGVLLFLLSVPGCLWPETTVPAAVCSPTTALNGSFNSSAVPFVCPCSFTHVG